MIGNFLIKTFLTLTLGLVGSFGVRAEITLSTLISDNMVVQAEKNWRISGYGKPNGKFKIRFNGDTDTIKVDASGNWRCELKLHGESSEKYKLEIDYTNKALSGHTFTNLVVGRVWIISLAPTEGVATSTADLGRIDARDLERIRYCTITNFLNLPPMRSNAIEWKQCSLESLRKGDLALLSLEYALTVADAGYIGIIQTYSETPLRESMRPSEYRPRSKLHEPLPEKIDAAWMNANELIDAAIRAQNARKVLLKRSGRIDNFPALSQYSKPHSRFPENLFSTNHPPANAIAFEWAFLCRELVPAR